MPAAREKNASSFVMKSENVADRLDLTDDLRPPEPFQIFWIYSR